MSTLFKHHTDLLGEFSQFLPDGSPDSGGGLFGLGGKGKGKASLGMGAAPLKPMAQRPGMKPSNRAQEDADEERYWQKRKNARREAPGGGARDAQRSREAEFFTKCRQRMPKPLYLELLKCLNLFSFKILERSELLTLAHDLFKRSQPDLYQVFRSLLPGYAGGDNRALDDGGDDGRAARPPMADAAHYRELDFSAMRKHGTSYRILPDDYQKPTCSGRGPLEQLVLNDSWVSVASGSEDLNFKQMRKNQYEEAIFRAEDERFELDTSIDTNMACLNALLPVQAELATKPESEKRRLRLEHLMPEKQGLSAMHMRAIKRLYGAQGAQVIELLQKCPAAAINPLVKRLQQKDTEWRALRTSLVKGWKEVYEKNFTKALDHRSFYFKQGDKKNFSGKQMVLELKALADPGAEGGGEKDGEEKKEGEAKAEAPGAGALALPFTIKGSSVPLSKLHDDALALFVFAAKLIFSQIGEEDVETKIQSFWGGFVLKFFACADVDAAAGAAGAAAMEVDGAAPRAKPVVVVSADAAEEGATREGRPPEQRWSHPLAYAKTSAQLFVGSSHFYIFARLYHVIIERLAAAKEMAAKSEELATQQEAKGGEAAGERTPGGSHGAAADENGVDGDGEKSETLSRAQLLDNLKKEHGGDLYAAFTSCLKQVVEGKMEPSVYEDLLRTLLGTNAYILFTLNKILHAALKQLQVLLVEDTAQKLLDLYNYERLRVAPGTMSEGTYRNNARMILEGDDAFQIEQQYADGGGELVMQFLPEKEAAEAEGEDGEVEEEDDDDDDAVDAGEKGEWAAYMASFVHVAAAAAGPKGRKGAVLLSRGARRTRKRAWGKAVLLQGLESRAAVGSCKLRFVSRSEDVWYANAAGGGRKRGAKRDALAAAKRQRLAGWLQKQPRDADANALAGLPPATPAPLPKMHKLKD